MAAGTSSRFAPLSYETHKSLLTVRGEVLIERQIRQIKDAGIDSVVLVGGYMKERFAYLREKFGVTIIDNPEYTCRNNHSSIYAARHLLGNSYICSSDNYFSRNPFESCVDDAYYAALYADGPTPEWCVYEGDDGYIDRVSVGGENAWYMMGHVFWSEPFSRKFVEILEREYDTPEIRDKLWEAVYAAHLDELKLLPCVRTEPESRMPAPLFRRFPISCRAAMTRTTSSSLTALTSCAALTPATSTTPARRSSGSSRRALAAARRHSPIFTRARRAAARRRSASPSDIRTRRISTTIKIKKWRRSMAKEIVQADLGRIRALLDEVLGHSDYSDVQRMGGLTNRTYCVTFADGSRIMVRIPGEGTEELIDRADEKVSTELACRLGIDAKLYFFGDDGEKVSQFVPNAVTMSAETMRGDKRIRQAAQLLKTLHDSGVDTGVPFEVFDMAAGYEKIIAENSVPMFGDYAQVKAAVMAVKQQVDSVCDIQNVPCHNDPLCENWVLSADDDRLYLIDWEYAGMNDGIWDLADVSIEGVFTPENDELLLTEYLGSKPDQNEYKHFLANKIYVDYLWTLWAKTRVPYDGQPMEDWAVERYARLKDNLRLFAEA